jgi:hypothetical protein
MGPRPRLVFNFSAVLLDLILHKLLDFVIHCDQVLKQNLVLTLNNMGMINSHGKRNILEGIA